MCMTQKAYLTMANNSLTQVDYYKLWQPISGQQFYGLGMYGDSKQDVGKYDKENLEKTS